MASNLVGSIISSCSSDASFAHSNGAGVKGSDALRNELLGMLGNTGFSMQVLTLAVCDNYIATQCAMLNGEVNVGFYKYNERKLFTEMRTFM